MSRFTMFINRKSRTQAVRILGLAALMLSVSLLIHAPTASAQTENWEEFVSDLGGNPDDYRPLDDEGWSGRETGGARGGKPGCSDGAGLAFEQFKGELKRRATSLFGPGTEATVTVFGTGERDINQVFDDCTDELGDGVGSGGAVGDPHLITLDGRNYDFHGRGDYVALRSNDIDVHLRFAASAGASAPAGAAFRVGDTVVTFEDLSFTGPPSVTVNGANANSAAMGWVEFADGSVVFAGRRTLLLLDSGIVAEASRIGISISTSPAFGGSFVGLLGDGDHNPDNDIKLADGTAVDPDDEDVLYGPFLDGWHLDPSASLLPTPFDIVASGPIRPENVPTFEDFHPQVKEAALQACEGSGLIGEPLAACAFDVAVTDDLRWAEQVSAVFARAMTDTSSEPRGSDTDLRIEELLVLADPAGGALSVSIQLRQGDRVYFESEQINLGRVSLIGPDGGTVLEDFASRDLGLVEIEQSGEYSLQFEADDVGDQERALVHWVANDLAESTTVGAATSFAFETPGQAATLSFQLARGQRVYLETTQGLLGDLELFDPNAQPAGSSFASQDLGLIEASIDGTYQLSIDPDSAVTGIYEIQLHDVPADYTNEVAPGELVTLSVAAPGQIASVAFQVNRGQLISVAVETSVFGDLTLTNSDGVELDSWLSSQDRGPVVADVSGTYTLSIKPDDANIGDQVVTILVE